jgi:hypothetical protein
VFEIGQADEFEFEVRKSEWFELANCGKSNQSINQSINRSIEPILLVREKKENIDEVAA